MPVEEIHPDGGIRIIQKPVTPKIAERPEFFFRHIAAQTLDRVRPEHRAFRNERNDFFRHERTIIFNARRYARLQRICVRFAGGHIVADIGETARALPREGARRIEGLHQPVQDVVYEKIAVRDLQGVTARLFVAAAPINQRRMVAESADLIFALFQRIVQPCGVVVGNVRTGEHKVLPDHQPRLVAQIVEYILFVNAAAPDAQHVHIPVFRQIDQFAVLILFDRPRKTTDRHPVRALDEDLFPVDLQFVADGIRAFRFLDQLYFPKRKPSRFFVGNFSVSDKLDLKRIQRLLPPSGRPPDGGIFDFEIDEIFLPRNGTFENGVLPRFRGFFQIYFQRIAGFFDRRAVDGYAVMIRRGADVVVQFRKDRYVASIVGSVMRVLDPVAAFRRQINIPPNPVTAQIGRPVPAEMALRLAHEQPRHVEHPEIAFAIDGFHLLDGGKHLYDKFVILFFQQRAHFIAIF